MRRLILLGGFLLFVLPFGLILVTLLFGGSLSKHTTVSDVIEKSPADGLLREGDILVTIGGNPVEEHIENVRAALDAARGPVQVEARRDGALFEVTITPVDGRIGVTLQPHPSYEGVSLAEAAPVAARFPLDEVIRTHDFVREFVHGLFAGEEKADVVGPVAMTQVIADELDTPGWVRVAGVVAIYSVRAGLVYVIIDGVLLLFGFVFKRRPRRV